MQFAEYKISMEDWDSERKFVNRNYTISQA